MSLFLSKTCNWTWWVFISCHIAVTSLCVQSKYLWPIYTLFMALVNLHLIIFLRDSIFYKWPSDSKKLVLVLILCNFPQWLGWWNSDHERQVYRWHQVVIVSTGLECKMILAKWRREFKMEQIQILLGYKLYCMVYDREEFDIEMRKGWGLRVGGMAVCQLENPLASGCHINFLVHQSSCAYSKSMIWRSCAGITCITFSRNKPG